MTNKKIENSLLALILADDVFWSELKLQRVQLQLGPIPSDSTCLASWVYFPVDALVTLSPVNSKHAEAVIVGRHGCVLPVQVQGSSMLARVMASGQAYCVDWNAVSEDPNRLAKWLRYSMTATQGLIGQMAQWSYCMQHHTTEQRLASWLLHCIAQSSNDELNVEISSLPLAIRQLLVLLQPGISQPGMSQPGISQPGMSQPGMSQTSHAWGLQIQDGCLRTTAPNLLRARACSCHQEMAVPKA